MSTLIIFLDPSKKVFHKITPHNQGAYFSSKERFDGRWDELAEHLEPTHHRNKRVVG